MKEIRSPVQASAAGQPKPERERFTLPQDWDRRCASATATLTQPHAASLAFPELPGSVKLYCVSVLLQFPHAIPESRVDAALRAVDHPRLTSTLKSAITDSDIRILAALGNWFPMREAGRATRRQIEAAASARTLSELQARTAQWTRSPDTPLQLTSTYAYFQIGICDVGDDSTVVPSTDPAAYVLTDALRSRLGVTPSVQLQFHTEFLDGLLTTVWNCQSLRLLAIAKKLVAGAACVLRADLTPVVSAEAHTINVAFRADSGDDEVACYRIAGHPHLTPTASAAMLGELLATIPGVDVQAVAETPRSEQFRRFRALLQEGRLPTITQYP